MNDMKTTAQFEAEDFTSCLSDTCDILAYTDVGVDSLNKTVKNWETETADVDCRIEPLKQTEDREFHIDNQVVTATYRMYIETTATITERHRVKWDDNTYYVGFADRFENQTTAHHREVLLAGVSTGGPLA